MRKTTPKPRHMNHVSRLRDSHSHTQLHGGHLVRFQIEDLSSAISDYVKLSPCKYRLLKFELVYCYCNRLGCLGGVVFHTFL